MTIIFYQLSTYIQTFEFRYSVNMSKNIEFLYTEVHIFFNLRNKTSYYIVHIHHHLFDDKLTTWLVFTSPNQAKVIIWSIIYELFFFGGNHILFMNSFVRLVGNA